jgi:hypothetical protein
MVSEVFVGGAELVSAPGDNLESSLDIQLTVALTNPLS